MIRELRKQEIDVHPDVYPDGARARSGLRSSISAGEPAAEYRRLMHGLRPPPACGTVL
jgi:hypothetical protein